MTYLKPPWTWDDLGHTVARRRVSLTSTLRELTPSGYIQLCNCLAKFFKELFPSAFDERSFQEACRVVAVKESGTYNVTAARTVRTFAEAVKICNTGDHARLFNIDGTYVKIFPARWAPPTEVKFPGETKRRGSSIF